VPRSSLRAIVNEEEFDALRRFGEGLMQDSRPEVHAAGKAILLLAAEVERLQVELWHARLNVPSATDPEAAAKQKEAVKQEEAAADSALDRTLPEELRSVLSRVTKRFQPDRFFQRG
jgi:hypothetical protein